MTTNHERYRAFRYARKLIEDLCDPGKTPRVPTLVRDRARTTLRHFPTEWEIERMTEKLPDMLENSNTLLEKKDEEK